MATIIVVGLGAMGSATALQLATRGHRVLGFDHFVPPHRQGSSHGHSRIIRQSYWEDPRYVPLLMRAYELWKKLEDDSGESLMRIVGGLMIGRPGGDLVTRSARSAELFSLPHELLSAAQIRRLYPAFQMEDDWIGLWEANAGYLRPEACIEQQLRLTASRGAELHFEEPITKWSAHPGGVAVSTARGAYSGDSLVITAGPWSPQILKDLRIPLSITRQVVFWFEPKGHVDHFRPEQMPVYIREMAHAQPLLYGFPFTGPDSDGVKVALHGSNNFCTPETVDRTIGSQDERTIRESLSQALPWLGGRLVHAETCLYTMTPDEHFVIDKHPEFDHVLLAAGFSGHGFKFASVLGEVLADLVTDAKASYDMELFSLRRFN
ncbi:MAG TPA: N-methyl-L-tryptophan oxidase [Acidobacteriaceae bacterium]